MTKGGDEQEADDFHGSGDHQGDEENEASSTSRALHSFRPGQLLMDGSAMKIAPQQGEHGEHHDTADPHTNMTSRSKP